MLDLAVNGYTAEQVIDALHGRSGSRGEIKFRYELLSKDDVKLGELKAQLGRVAMNSLAEIKRTAVFQVTEGEGKDIDWLNDRIRPVFCLKMPEIRKTYKAWGKIDASLSRSSIAYLSDGTRVAANVPRFEPGKFGKAIMVEEGTENLLKEPLFNGALDTTYWNTRNAAYTLSIDTSTKYMGYNSLKIVANKIGGAGSDIIMKSTQMPTIDTDYVFSFYAKASEPVKLTVRWGLGATQNSVDITTEWQKYSVVARTGSQAYQDLLSYFDKIATLWIALPQLEAKPYPTSFIDGTRAAESLTIPTAGALNPQEGTIECWVYVNDIIKRLNPSATYGKRIFHIPGGAFVNGLMLYHDFNAANWVLASFNDAGAASTITISDTITPNGWHMFSVAWNSQELKLFIDGQSAGNVPSPKLPTSFAPNMYIGSRDGVIAEAFANTLIDDLRISNKARSDAEILAAYQSGQPAPIDEWTTAKFDFDNRQTGEYYIVINEVKPAQWIEWPLGVFLLSSPTRKDENRKIKRDIEAYDASLILKEDKFTDRYLIAAGTKYTAAIIDILNNAGIWKINIIDHPGRLATDREFEIGTSKLFAVNELLAAINYTSLWVDENGYFVAQPYVLPSSRDPEYEYRTDDLSIIHPDSGVEELDLFGVPNKWVRYVSNPDRNIVLRSEYINDLSASPTSTINRGRTIVDIDSVEDIYDQATLDEYVRRIAYNASQVYGKFEFTTALMPHHSYYNCLFVEYDPLGISHKYMESSWTMDLHANGVMRHSCRRVIQI